MTCDYNLFGSFCVQFYYFRCIYTHTLLYVGMDPKIRRDIWNLILRSKKNRVTIMTTHSMEEADILGDTIAILANGRLK